MAACRFFDVNDERIERVDNFPVPPDWWSRPYEYAWASNFVNPGETVLDAGCGLEHPFKFYLGRRVTAHACDVDPNIKYVVVPPGCNLTLVRADFTLLPYPDEYFDTIFCISVLEHVSMATQDSGIKEFKRVLKPGGRLVVTVDVPLVHPEHLINMVKNAALEVGKVNYMLPGNAITGYDLHCFKILATK
jgi:SAM-dependent methyltransferase